MSGTVGILYVFTCSSSCLIVAASRLPLIALMPWRCSCCVRGVSFRCFLVAPLVIKQPRGRTAVCWTSHASVFVGFGVSYRRYRLFGDSMFSFRLVASRQPVYGRPCRGWFSGGRGESSVAFVCPCRAQKEHGSPKIGAQIKTLRRLLSFGRDERV